MFKINLFEGYTTQNLQVKANGRELVADQAGIDQADWMLVRRGELECHMERKLAALEERFAYPMFVKPAGTGSSVGVSKAADREALRQAEPDFLCDSVARLRDVLLALL